MPDPSHSSRPVSASASSAVSRCGASTLTAKVVSKPSTVTRGVSPRTHTPALWASTSSGPCSRTCSASARTCARSARSPVTRWTSPSSASTTGRPRSSERACTSTRCPSASRRRAAARPIPSVEPVRHTVVMAGPLPGWARVPGDPAPGAATRGCRGHRSPGGSRPGVTRHGARTRGCRGHRSPGRERRRAATRHLVLGHAGVAGTDRRVGVPRRAGAPTRAQARGDPAPGARTRGCRGHRSPGRAPAAGRPAPGARHAGVADRGRVGGRGEGDPAPGARTRGCRGHRWPGRGRGEPRTRHLVPGHAGVAGTDRRVGGRRSAGGAAHERRAGRATRHLVPGHAGVAGTDRRVGGRRRPGDPAPGARTRGCRGHRSPGRRVRPEPPGARARRPAGRTDVGSARGCSRRRRAGHPAGARARARRQAARRRPRPPSCWRPPATTSTELCAVGRPGPRPGAHRRRSAGHRHLQPQGVHPADPAVPGPLPLLHVRHLARPRSASAVPDPRRGARHRPPGRGAGLQGGAVHPRRPARGALAAGAGSGSRRPATTTRCPTSAPRRSRCSEETGLLPHLNPGVMIVGRAAAAQAGRSEHGDDARDHRGRPRAHGRRRTRSPLSGCRSSRTPAGTRSRSPPACSSASARPSPTAPRRCSRSGRATCGTATCRR